MQLHEEFGISVLDDTVYRALKELGFSSISVRLKAYKQDPFKKNFPYVWRKSARRLRQAR
jgi:transposase